MDPPMIPAATIAAVLLFLVPAALVLGAICSGRRHSNTSGQVLERAFQLSPDETQEHGPNDDDIAFLEEDKLDGANRPRESSRGSDSTSSMFNRFQAPEAQDRVYGVAQPPLPQHEHTSRDDDSDSGTQVNRFVAVSGTHVRLC